MKRILVLAAALSLSLGAVAQQTPNMKLNTPATGTANWGPAINANFNTIDTLTGGLLHAFQGAWSSTTVYSQSQIVIFNGSSYMSLVASNVNNNPATATAAWGLLAAASSAGGIAQLTGDVLASGVGSVSSILATVNLSPGTCGDATHTSQITVDAKGRTTNCIPVAITGGTAQAAGVFEDLQINGGGTSPALAADSGILQHNSTTHTTALLNISNTQKFNPINQYGAHFRQTSDFQESQGSAGNGGNREALPYSTSYIQSSRNAGGNDVALYNDTLTIQQGFENGQNYLTNFGYRIETGNIYSAGQLGGWHALFINQFGVGDTVKETENINSAGSSRPQDEGFEPEGRDFYGFVTPNWGGNVAFGTALASGDVPMTLTPFGGYQIINPSNSTVLLDVTRKVAAGNVTATAVSTVSPNFIDVTLDTPHSLGVTTFTTITAATTDLIYTGTCPNITSTGLDFPAIEPNLGQGDGHTVPVFGPGADVGLPQRNGNFVNAPGGALVGNCISVASTVGLSAGTKVAFYNFDLTSEYDTVIAVVDATHFTSYLHHNQPSGTVVSWGGAVGWGLGMSADDLPPGTLTHGGSNQNAQYKLVYPIVGSKDSTHATLFVNSSGSITAEFKTLGYGATTPRIPLTISATVTAGVVTAITGSANNYTQNTGVSGSKPFLPPPVFAITGCTVAPTINIVQSGASYKPVLLSGGSGCGTVAFAEQPDANPAYFVPVSWAEYVADPNNCSTDPGGQTTCSTGDGYVVSDVWAAGGSTVQNGDEIAGGRFWNRYGGGGFISLQKDPIVNFSGKSEGDIINRSYGELPHGGSYFHPVDITPSAEYIGTFASHWGAMAGHPEYGQKDPGAGVHLSGSTNKIFIDSPPTGGSLSTFFQGADTTVPALGDTLIQVGCAPPTAEFAPGIPFDYPCLHSQHYAWGIISNEVGDVLWNDPASHTLAWTNLNGTLGTFRTAQLVLQNAGTNAVNINYHSTAGEGTASQAGCLTWNDLDFGVSGQQICVTKDFGSQAQMVFNMPFVGEVLHFFTNGSTTNGVFTPAVQFLGGTATAGGASIDVLNATAWNPASAPFLASGTGHNVGLVPDPGATAGSTRFLREDGTWSVPAGGSGGGLPTGAINQMLYYAAAGNTVTPLTLGTNLSITAGVLNAAGGGGGSSVGSINVMQKVGATAGSFAASSITDNATDVRSTEAIISLLAGSASAVNIGVGSAGTGLFSTNPATALALSVNSLEQARLGVNGLLLALKPLCWGTSFGCSLSIGPSASNGVLTVQNSQTVSNTPTGPLSSTFNLNQIQAATSASSVAITGGIVNISGTAAIATLALPAANVSTTLGFCIHINPTGAFTFTTGGNISNPTAVTPAVGTAFTACWFGTGWTLYPPGGATGGSGITALTGDVTASGPGSVAATVARINGTSLAGLASGFLMNTTGTGVPHIAAAADILALLASDTVNNTSVGFHTGSGGDATVAPPLAGADYLAMKGGVLSYSHSGAAYVPFVNGTAVIANATITVPATAIAANTCNTVTAITMTGLATTSVIAAIPQVDVSAVTGWGATGGLVLDIWPSAANTASVKTCNQTASSITPSAAVTFNLGAK